MKIRSSRFVVPGLPLVALLFIVLNLCPGALAPAGAAPVYVAIGASDALGYGASNYSETNPAQRNNGYVYLIHNWMRERYAPWTLANLGISGATVSSVVDNGLNPAIALRPAIVTVWVGGNDIKNSVLAGEATEVLKARFEISLDLLLRRLRAETGAFIVIANLPDMSRIPIARFFGSATQQLGKADSIALNEVIARIAALYSVSVVDLYGDPETYNWVNYSWDGFHPNDAGYAKMAAKFEEVLRQDAWRIVSGLGDVDGDGSVSAADAADILRASGGLIPLDERAAIAADTSPADGGTAPGIPDAVRLLLRTQGSIPDSEWK